MQDGVHGTYAEYTPVTAGKLMPVPDALSLQVATAATNPNPNPNPNPNADPNPN